LEVYEVHLLHLKFEVYEVHTVQSRIFALTIGMHKKKSYPTIGAVSTDTAMHIELSDVVAALTSFC
jgi:hypothetical protein